MRTPGFYEDNLATGFAALAVAASYCFDCSRTAMAASGVGGYVFGKYFGRNLDKKVLDEIEKVKLRRFDCPDSINADYC